jgi:hypothetical protein
VFAPSIYTQQQAELRKPAGPCVDRIESGGFSKNYLCSSGEVCPKVTQDLGLGGSYIIPTLWTKSTPTSVHVRSLRDSVRSDVQLAMILNTEYADDAVTYTSCEWAGADSHACVYNREVCDYVLDDLNRSFIGRMGWQARVRFASVTVDEVV